MKFAVACKKHTFSIERGNAEEKKKKKNFGPPLNRNDPVFLVLSHTHVIPSIYLYFFDDLNGMGDVEEKKNE